MSNKYSALYSKHFKLFIVSFLSLLIAKESLTVSVYLNNCVNLSIWT